VDNISLLPQILDNMVVGNLEEVVFALRTHFLLKIPRKHSIHLDKFINGFKKLKNHPKKKST